MGCNAAGCKKAWRQAAGCAAGCRRRRRLPADAVATPAASDEGWSDWCARAGSRAGCAKGARVPADAAHACQAREHCSRRARSLTERRRRHHQGRRITPRAAVHARRWRSFWRSRRPIRTACCSTAWAISTSCSSRTRSPPPQALGIVLTKRGKHLGEDIPMCGVPIHRADEYLQRLITAGLPRRRLRADGGSGGGQEARLQGGGAPRRGAPRHARHADRGQPARRQGAQLPHRRVQRRRKAGSGQATDRAGLARHLDRRVRGGRGRRRPTSPARSCACRPAR